MANENTPTTSPQESPKSAPDSQPNPSRPAESKPDQKGAPVEIKEERARN